MPLSKVGRDDCMHVPPSREAEACYDQAPSFGAVAWARRNMALSSSLWAGSERSSKAPRLRIQTGSDLDPSRLYWNVASGRASTPLWCGVESPWLAGLPDPDLRWSGGWILQDTWQLLRSATELHVVYKYRQVPWPARTTAVTGAPQASRHSMCASSHGSRHGCRSRWNTTAIAVGDGRRVGGVAQTLLACVSACHQRRKYDASLDRRAIACCSLDCSLFAVVVANDTKKTPSLVRDRADRAIHVMSGDSTLASGGQGWRSRNNVGGVGSCRPVHAMQGRAGNWVGLSADADIG